MKPDLSQRPRHGVRYAVVLDTSRRGLEGGAEALVYRGFVYWADGEAALSLSVDASTGAVHAKLDENALDSVLQSKGRDLARTAAALVRSAAKSAEAPVRKIVRWRPLT